MYKICISVPRKYQQCKCWPQTNQQNNSLTEHRSWCTLLQPKVLQPYGGLLQPYKGLHKPIKNCFLIQQILSQKSKNISIMQHIKTSTYKCSAWEHEVFRQSLYWLQSVTQPCQHHCCTSSLAKKRNVMMTFTSALPSLLDSFASHAGCLSHH